MSCLAAIAISKRYRHRLVVDQVTLQVRSGEVVGLLGPNGAGKTTCFYMIAGLIGCDTGEILIDQTPLTRAPVHRRARQGLTYLPQEASVFRRLTVRENVLAILELRRDLDRRARQERLDALLADLHISHLADQKGYSLSGGERRRVEIARALASDPRFVLLDEPFAGVDPISVGDIQEIVRHLVDRDIGVLITDHNVRETLGICHRAYILNEGKVIASGTPGEILADDQVRACYLGETFRL
ncbi:MAG: LPS export ABC transporter ATP-binding protein [Gammaproteobacteria bacterium]|nr:MAG: LPS export ABC transporter ATP-binding protein [Gammaproteobacteria bacterium]